MSSITRLGDQGDRLTGSCRSHSALLPQNLWWEENHQQLNCAIEDIGRYMMEILSSLFVQESLIIMLAKVRKVFLFSDITLKNIF